MTICETALHGVIFKVKLERIHGTVHEDGQVRWGGARSPGAYTRDPLLTSTDQSR